MEELNERQKEFARLLAKGVAQGKAYRKAFDCKGKSDSAVNSMACRLAKNVNVLQFVASLSRQRDDAAIASRQERMEWLSARMRECGESGAVRDGVACIAELNKMDGAYQQPDGVQVNVQQGVSVAEVVEAVMLQGMR